MRFALFFVFAAVFAMPGMAEAQCYSRAALVAPVYAAPLVAAPIYAAPIVQLQQVVAPPAPVVQQQVQPQVQQVVTPPALPVVSYAIAAPVVAQHHIAPLAVVQNGYHRGGAAAIVVPQRFVQQRFIVANRAQRIAVVQQVRRPNNVLQLNFGRRR